MPLTTSGVSLGAFYAANAVLKHSEEFRYALCMSGMYDTQAMLGGLASREVHYSNPMAYVPGLNGELLETIAERVHLDLICGQGKWEDEYPRDPSLPFRTDRPWNFRPYRSVGSRCRS